MNHTLNIASSTLTSSINLWRGTNARPAKKKPAKLLELYDMEGCPFCRLVREALTELDLEAMIFPCPKNGRRFRAEVKKLGGKTQFPFLRDPNTGVKLYESADIIKYLYKIYGERSLPLKWHLMPLQKVSSAVSTGVRPRQGLYRQSSKEIDKPLELFSFESSPYSRPVRELLCELEIPYHLHNAGKRELVDFVLPNLRKKFMPKKKVAHGPRAELVKRGGKLMVPFLIDPNTGVKLYESADILKYLKTTYAVS